VESRFKKTMKVEEGLFGKRERISERVEERQQRVMRG
jgi:hypothetical protein